MQCPKCETEFPPHKDWRAVEDSSGSSVLVTDCCACHESFDLSELVLQVKCGFCTLNICDDFGLDFSLRYPNLVCNDCQGKALNKDGNSAVHLSWVEQTPPALILASGIEVLSISTWLDQISRVA
jgi:hypothetical protein